MSMETNSTVQTFNSVQLFFVTDCREQWKQMIWKKNVQLSCQWKGSY